MYKLILLIINLEISLRLGSKGSKIGDFLEKN